MDVVELFAARVREERRRLGVSQEKLAEMAGLHRTYVSNLERAKINATLRNAALVADALGLDLAHLLVTPDAGGNEGSGAQTRESPGHYVARPASVSAGMRLRISLEADEEGLLSGSGRARFGDRVFPFRVDDARDAERDRDERPKA